jgi:hypothetical protein
MNFLKRIKSAIPVGELGGMATVLVIVGITIGIATLILANVQAETPVGSVANLTIESGIDAMGTFGDWLGIIAIVIVAVVVLSLIKYL